MASVRKIGIKIVYLSGRVSSVSGMEPKEADRRYKEALGDGRVDYVDYLWSR